MGLQRVLEAFVFVEGGTKPLRVFYNIRSVTSMTKVGRAVL